MLTQLRLDLNTVQTLTCDLPRSVKPNKVYITGLQEKWM